MQPALRTILTTKQAMALSESVEEDVHRVLSDEVFQRIVDEVAAMEKQLGIYDLKQLTYRVSCWLVW